MCSTHFQVLGTHCIANRPGPWPHGTDCLVRTQKQEVKGRKPLWLVWASMISRLFLLGLSGKISLRPERWEWNGHTKNRWREEISKYRKQHEQSSLCREDPWGIEKVSVSQVQLLQKPILSKDLSVDTRIWVPEIHWGEVGCPKSHWEEGRKGNQGRSGYHAGYYYGLLGFIYTGEHWGTV